jgi:hypothetical protein
MKNFIVSNIKFTLIIIVVCTALAALDNTDNNISVNHNVRSLQDKSEYDDLDILFIGNSYCYSGIIPSMLDSMGIKSYNLGIATAGVDFYDLAAKDYFDNIEYYPKYVFILISPMTFSRKADNFSFFPVHRYLENPKSHFEIAKQYRKWDIVIPGYKKSIKKGLINLLKSNLFNKDKHLQVKAKGYSYSGKIFSQEIKKEDEHLYTALLSDSWKEFNLNKIYKLTSWIKGKGTSVIYFELPNNELDNYFSRDYLSSYNSLIDSLSKSNQVFIINDSLFSSSNFYNIDHLNYSGAKIATKEMMKYSFTTNIIEDIKMVN